MHWHEVRKHCDMDGFQGMLSLCIKVNIKRTSCENICIRCVNFAKHQQSAFRRLWLRGGQESVSFDVKDNLLYRCMHKWFRAFEYWWTHNFNREGKGFSSTVRNKEIILVTVGLYAEWLCWKHGCSITPRTRSTHFHGNISKNIRRSMIYLPNYAKLLLHIEIQVPQERENMNQIPFSIS